MKHILFVCYANVCRSPLAEGIAKKIIHKNNLDLSVDSAATTGTHEREQPCNSSIKIAALHDMDISDIRSRQIKASDSVKYDYIVAMDNHNKKILEESGFKNIYLMGDFGGHKGKDIPDPYYKDDFNEDIKGIYDIYHIIDTSVQDFIDKVSKKEL